MKPAWISLSGILFACAAAQAAAATAPSHWYVITTGDGQVIGHASRTVTPTSDGREVMDARRVSLAQQGGPPKEAVQKTLRREDARGRVRSVESTAQTGKDETRVEALIVGDEARITWTSALDRRTAVTRLPASVRFDGGEALLRTWDPPTRPQLTFDSFDLGAGAVEQVVVEVAPGAARDAEGRLPVLRRTYDGETLVGVARLLVNRDGEIVSTTQAMLGAAITFRLTDEKTALARPMPYWPLGDTMIKSPFRIPPSATKSHIRYRFGFRDGVAFTPPRTGEQRVASTASGVEIDICDACGPGLPSDPAALAEARRPTAWLQSDHPRLKAIAAPIARMSISDTAKMERLRRKAARYLTQVDFSGHYSALETLSRRRGDCTEAAVLLAALGRSAGIPTRVVNGLVYSRERYHGVSHAFMPHSWTVAYVDGEWRSFDLALDAFDNTHIALTVGDGDPRSLLAAGQLASLLVWQGMVEVRTPPAS
ncbi:transglutaminase-like domain-containing protein [Caulobacter mirabilis]|uniref:Transglutaminase-like domain-containing protein n=1 Tax=Caulobacter mirabilis TaxID=69666 RepID=A0A2D2AV91_9CAUL|nr:transglutaminase-like domain-containing protein [Caulobacter mirabilis]ATQ41913.1 hypothetical protein CSW64_05545 [Caulobacter mirabilis]